ncbi:MAG TPA: CHASE3 domain-containing protein [Gemmatimonadaceae bacterium]|nr:CHASE3 domain-containing protein [Gemmatimonadaceae bacterium]
MALSLPGPAQRRVLALVPAALVLLLGALAYDRARKVVADVDEVERSHAINVASEHLLARAVDAETGQRAFLLTGDETFLEQYHGALADINRYVDSLRKLTSTDRGQAVRVSAIEKLIPGRFAYLDTGIALRRAGAGNATDPARLLAGKRKMDQLRAAVENLQTHERGVLSERHDEEQRSLRNASIVVGVGGVVALLLSVLINLGFSRAVQDRDRANEGLRQINEDLERQSEQLETQAVEMESQAAELEVTAEDLRATNDELNLTSRLAEDARDSAEKARLQLERVLENLPDAASVFDSEWRWTFLNPAAKRILGDLGIDGDRVKGKVLWEEIAHLKGTKFETEARRAAREGRVVQFEEYLPDLDAWMENTIVPANDLTMTFTRDVTRKKRERQGAELLSEASRVLASTLDYEKTLDAVARLAVGSLADWCGVDLVQSDGKVHQVIVAHIDEEKIKWAKELNKRYPPDYTAETGVGSVIRTGKPEVYAEISDEMLVASARDKEHLAIMRALQIRSALVVPMIARGRTLGALTLISTRKARRYDDADLALAMEIATRAAIAIDNAHLYGSALAASEAKSAFLATMSHELRTPLNAIIGYGSLLEEGIDGSLNQSQLAQLGRIRASADHLLELIDEVLTFSRLDAGKEVLRREEVRLRPVLEEAVSMVTPISEAKGLKLRVDTPDATVFTDEGKLRQIVLNLLSNAIKFTDRGEITVRSRVDDGTAQISVSDDGIGVAPENIERIFEPFWQVEQSATRRAGGTGLGLSVSRSLARLLGGDVTAESKLGEGSAFTLTLPVSRN